MINTTPSPEKSWIKSLISQATKARRKVSEILSRLTKSPEIRQLEDLVTQAVDDGAKIAKCIINKKQVDASEVRFYRQTFSQLVNMPSNHKRVSSMNFPQICWLLTKIDITNDPLLVLEICKLYQKRSYHELHWMYIVLSMQAAQKSVGQWSAHDELTT